MLCCPLMVWPDRSPLELISEALHRHWPPANETHPLWTWKERGSHSIQVKTGVKTELIKTQWLSGRTGNQLSQEQSLLPGGRAEASPQHSPVPGQMPWYPVLGGVLRVAFDEPLCTNCGLALEGGGHTFKRETRSDMCCYLQKVQQFPLWKPSSWPGSGCRIRRNPCELPESVCTAQWAPQAIPAGESSSWPLCILSLCCPTCALGKLSSQKQRCNSQTPDTGLT